MGSQGPTERADPEGNAMKCRECGAEPERFDNAHLLHCSGLTLQEYAIRHQLPLELVVPRDLVNAADSPDNYRRTSKCPGEDARATLCGLRWAGLVQTHDGLAEVRGEVRRLELLLWALERLADYGFRYCQSYEYTADTHRVVARNQLRTRAVNLGRDPAWVGMEPPPAFLDALAVYVAHSAELLGGYLFMQFNCAHQGEDVRQALWRDHAVHCKALDAADHPGGLLLRTCETADTRRLLDLLDGRLRSMPTAAERFNADTPAATVSKELVFDAAHFITDHPAKCSNLHGGRYVLQVEVSDRIDPMTGCVVDYGYLKRVVSKQVVERFDHHNLNYAAGELAWRSSTEMLCAHIWECLIDYLPALSRLRLYETPQSWCDYRGPTLADYQAQGSNTLLHPFAGPADSERRRQLLLAEPATLRTVAGQSVIGAGR